MARTARSLEVAPRPGGAAATARRPRSGKRERAVGDAPPAAQLATVTTLAQFLATAGSLTKAEKVVLIDQASIMIDQLYVHLSLKRAMHAVDPVQRLALVKQRLDSYSERQFHDEMIAIFTGLRDLHTNYVLPAPYNTKVAFLPFLMEELFDADARRYMVTKMLAGFTHATFRPGVLVTHWNGIPIDRAVEVNADRNAGSNPDARHARGLEAMTVRSMMMAAAPDEHWVIVGYEDGATPRELKLDWRVFEPDPTPNGGATPNGRAAIGPRRSSPPRAATLGIDAGMELARRAKKALFNPAAMTTERAAVAADTATRANMAKNGKTARTGEVVTPVAADTSTMPDVFSFKSVTTPSGALGYVRIWTFMAEVDPFVNELIRILSLLPQDGLIIDVRGNGGGNIMCAELSLQLFTPRSVRPSTLSFVNHPLTLAICKHNDWVGKWAPSIAQSIETGEVHSQGFALEDDSAYNSIGQRYQGPVALITDPLCYSATDIFSAGFQDNALGPILSAGGRTGAGGANVWDHDLLAQVLPTSSNPFKALPKGASFRVSVRRVMRSGIHQGVPLEDLGVTPDANHAMTRNDVLNGNVDLINTAAAMLGNTPRMMLSATVAAPTGGQRTITFVSKGLDRVDALVDGRPRGSADTTDGTSTMQIPHAGAGTHELALHGYKAGELRARFTTDL